MLLDMTLKPVLWHQSAVRSTVSVLLSPTIAVAATFPAEVGKQGRRVYLRGNERPSRSHA